MESPPNFSRAQRAEGERDHGFAGDAGGGHDTNVGALVGGLHRLAGCEVD